MLPIAEGADVTRKHILGYSLLLAPVGLAPSFVGLGGMLYSVTAALAGAMFVALAWRVYAHREGKEADQAARRLFGFSVLYLFVLFAVLLIEHTSGGGLFGSFPAWAK